MKGFISKNDYYLHISGRKYVRGDIAPLTDIQKLLSIKYRRKIKIDGHIQYLTQSKVNTIELSDMVRKYLVCSERYLEANHEALLKVDTLTLQNIISANAEPHLVYEFWLPIQNFNHEHRVLAYLEVVSIQGKAKVMVSDVAIWDNSGNSGTPEILRTVGGLHISLDSPVWLKGQEVAVGHAVFPPVELKGEYYAV